VGGLDQVVLDTLGILDFFSFGNLNLVGQFGNDQLFVGTMPGVNVTVTGSGGQAGGGGFYNVLNFDPKTQFVTVTPTTINVAGAPPVSIAGISQLNFLNSLADVSALVKIIASSKAKRLSHNRIKLHLTLQDITALALGGPLLLILSGLTGGALALGGGVTTHVGAAGVGQQFVPIFTGVVPLLHAGQEVGFDVVFRTTHSGVAFNPFFVIAGIMP